jgi:excisionase family DNA binding protein
VGIHENVLNADEVARWLRVPKSTLYKLCSEGQIPCAKIGKHWRFDKALVESWFKKRIAQSTHAYETNIQTSNH